MHAVVIPYRGPDGAKQRLASALSPLARRTVSAAMLRHVYGVAIGTVGAEHVLVACSSAAAICDICASGSQILEARLIGLNGALDAACGRLWSSGYLTATIIAADLPLLRAADLAEMLPGDDRSIKIAPDHAGRGTNGLTVPLRSRPRFQFGANSFAKHCAATSRMGLKAMVVRRDGLANDVDVEADLAWIGSTGTADELELSRSLTR